MSGFDINRCVFTGIIIDAVIDNFDDKQGRTVEHTKFKLRVEVGNKTELHQFKAFRDMATQAVSLADHKVLITGKVRSWQSKDGHLYEHLVAQTISPSGVTKAYSKLP